MDAHTRSVWLLGDPVEHSRSPAMHNPAYAAMGLNWVYLASRVLPSQLAEALQALRVLGAVGANLTIPHKEAVLPYLVSITPAARAIGAVNTIRLSEAGWEGHNTDGEGWLASWDEVIGAPLEGRRIILLGAGGAARSILCAVGSRGAEDLVILNRNQQRAAALNQGRVGPLEDLATHLSPGCVVINTTSVGMWPNIEDLPITWPSQVPPGTVACDLIYNPRPTRFLLEAAQLGAANLDGSGMLIHQAARAITWWSGREDVPVATMARVFLE